MDSRPDRLQRRNVEVYDFDGAVIAGFWQYGTLQWAEFYRYLFQFVVSATPWSVFSYDTTTMQHGAVCPSDVQIEHHYRSRAYKRDGKCLITGLKTQTYSRLQVAHIFPRAHDIEWIRKGYPSKITDDEDISCMGGPTKIDSVQNIITMRSDLHDAWDNYEFGVDPNNNYRITAFTNGNEDINGCHLQLDHIEDPKHFPLDDLFTDHFVQGLFKHLKGAGELGRTYEEFDDTFGDGNFDLSDAKIWGTREGKERLELELLGRLYDRRLSEQNAAAMGT
ncbi:hypothetical protein CPB84DRAFT_1790392 [Gymnopilus junonius]|uniref:HNH nuclease domain-containing protein n=1 Tax=Gymnopilus junonius TaxID=109634 RepID=A0A9P5NH07_GYMJU|nr:hypothetical protein CPB84DRAFT_1790392 [Gymnopilus junonius]